MIKSEGNTNIRDQIVQICRKTELGGAGGQTARQLSPPYLEHRKHGQQLMVIVVFSIIIANWMIFDKHHFSLSNKSS